MIQAKATLPLHLRSPRLPGQELRSGPVSSLPRRPTPAHLATHFTSPPSRPAACPSPSRGLHPRWKCARFSPTSSATSRSSSRSLTSPSAVRQPRARASARRLPCSASGWPCPASQPSAPGPHAPVRPVRPCAPPPAPRNWDEARDGPIENNAGTMGPLDITPEGLRATAERRKKNMGPKVGMWLKARPRTHASARL